MEIQDIHVGNQLHASSAMGQLSPAITPAVRDPTCLGIGPASIPGSIFANGCVLIGSPLAFPAIAEANLMISRSNPLVNPLAAKVPSIFKITSKFAAAPTPLDVMIGDPGVGMVGMTLNTAMINIVESVAINIVAPVRNSTGVKNHAGAKTQTGAESNTGAKADVGAETQIGASCESNIKAVSGPQKTPFLQGFFFTGYSKKNKSFDIEHPNKKGWRLRHVCVEGPESAIYIRGKLKGAHIIDIPDYWQGLVDYDTITVNLTPCGKPDLSLYVKEIRDNKIILSSDHLTQVECFYQVWANRIGPELHVEYEGESPADYPGDQSDHSIAGYHYDKEDV